MVVGIVDSPIYEEIAKGLLGIGYQVINVVNTCNVKDPVDIERSVLHKALICKTIVVDPNSTDPVADSIIRQAAHNGQIVILDSMKVAEDTINHIKKEISNA